MLSCDVAVLKAAILGPTLETNGFKRVCGLALGPGVPEGSEAPLVWAGARRQCRRLVAPPELTGRSGG